MNIIIQAYIIFHCNKYTNKTIMSGGIVDNKKVNFEINCLIESELKFSELNKA